MALSLNFTLVIQAFHFLVAYWFISRLLLKPAYRLLQAEIKKLSDLRARVVHEQEYLALQQERKHQGWQDCQEYFYKNRPVLERPQERAVERAASITPGKELTHDELDALSDEVVLDLKSKVLHD